VRYTLLYLLLALLGLLVFWTGYSAATQGRYDAANGITGQILDGNSVGQTFVARYNDLSSVEVRIATYGRQTDPSRAPLVMHLRAAPDSAADLAVATLSPTTRLEENGWYRFSFAPLPDSRGTTYYLEISSPGASVDTALALFWFKPNPEGDPYPDGAAYRNGKRTGADLAFGLGYSEQPLAVWRGMLGSAAANSSPIAIGALLLAAVAITLWTFAYLPRIFRDPTARRRWLLRWSLPFVLSVTLAYGLLFILIVPPWQGPDEYSHFAYAALLDSHDLDDRRVQILDLDFRDRDTDLIEAVNASADRHDFTRLFLGSASPGAPTDVGQTIFQQIRQPASYYWLCALGLRVARFLGFPADPHTNPEAALTTMRLVSLLLGLVVVALAWLAAFLLARPTHPWLMLILPLTVALLPMHTFISTVVNNDILAEVALSALFVSLLALLRRPTGPRGAAMALLSILLALAALYTKSTAVVAAFPLLVGGLIIWLVILFTKPRTPTRTSTNPLLRLVPYAISLAAIALALIAASLLAFSRQDTVASGWFTGLDPIARAARIQTATAHQGNYVLQPDPPTATTFQDIIPPIYHPALDVTFSGWARLTPGQPLTASQPLTARLAIMEGDRTAGTSGITLQPSSDWTRLETHGNISASAARVRLVLSASPAPSAVQFDDFSLDLHGTAAPWNDPIYTPTLVNPSAEDAPLQLNAWLSGPLPNDVRPIADALANPQPFDKSALWRDYASSQYRSFWSGFGWLTIYLPPPFYVFLTLLVLLSICGFLIRAARTPPSRWTWLGLVSLLVLVAAIISGFAKQMALTAYAGQPAFPQGRYLFVLTIPLAWLLLSGLAQIARLTKSHLPLRITALTPPPRWLWITALFLLTTYSLFSLIFPYYYR
jgi:hypothetical protein